METRNDPKLSTSSLEVKSNYYVIPLTNGEQTEFHYFPIKITDETKDQPIMRFAKAPPVLVQGVAIIARKVYEVTIPDLQRGLVRKSREVKLRTEKTYDDSSTRIPTSAATPDSGVVANSVEFTDQGGQQYRVSEAPELEFVEAANSAWQGQIETLLDFVSAQEGGQWEITSTP